MLIFRRCLTSTLLSQQTAKIERLTLTLTIPGMLLAKCFLVHQCRSKFFRFKADASILSVINNIHFDLYKKLFLRFNIFRYVMAILNCRLIIFL